MGRAVANPPGQEHFDRHLAIETRVPGEMHFAHATGPERGDDFVGTQPSTGTERHSVTRLADGGDARNGIALLARKLRRSRNQQRPVRTALR